MPDGVTSAWARVLLTPGRCRRRAKKGGAICNRGCFGRYTPCRVHSGTFTHVAHKTAKPAPGASFPSDSAAYSLHSTEVPTWDHAGIKTLRSCGARCRTQSKRHLPRRCGALPLRATAAAVPQQAGSRARRHDDPAGRQHGWRQPHAVWCGVGWGPPHGVHGHAAVGRQRDRPYRSTAGGSALSSAPLPHPTEGAPAARPLAAARARLRRVPAPLPARLTQPCSTRCRPATACWTS